MVKDKRKHEQKLIEYRYRARILSNIDTDKFNKSLD